MLFDERIIAVWEEPNLHIACNQRDVPDGMLTPWKFLNCLMFLLPQRQLTSLRGPTVVSDDGDGESVRRGSQPQAQQQCMQTQKVIETVWWTAKQGG